MKWIANNIILFKLLNNVGQNFNFIWSVLTYEDIH